MPLPLFVALSLAVGIWGSPAPALAARQDVATNVLSPKNGESIAIGKVLAVMAAENRLVIAVTKVVSNDGIVTQLPEPVTKSVVLSGTTSYCLLPKAANKISLGDVQPNAIVQVVGRNDGPGSPVIARLIAVEPETDAEQIDLWKLMPVVQKSSWWRLIVKSPAEAHGTAEKDGTYKLTVEVPGKLPPSVQIVQGGLKFQNGQKWHLHFRAKSDTARTIKLSAMIGSDDFHSIGMREIVSLEPVAKAYDYTFTVEKTTEAGKYFCPAISLGDKTGTVWISEMSLVEVKDTAKGDKAETESKDANKEKDSIPK